MIFEQKVILRFTLLAQKYVFEYHVILRFTPFARKYDILAKK